MRFRLWLVLGMAWAWFSMHGAETTPEDPPENEIHLNTFFQERDLRLDVVALREVAAWGDTVDMEGAYHEDVWAGGRRVGFRGHALRDARLAALEVLMVDARVDGGLRAHSMGNLLVNTNTVVRGHTVLSAREALTLNGEFSGDVRATAERVVVDAKVRGTLTLHALETVILPSTRIEGDLLYEMENAPGVPAGVVQGQVARGTRPAPTLEDALARLHWQFMGVLFLTCFVSGLLLVRFLPRFAGTCVESTLLLHGGTLVLGLVTTGLLFLGGLLLLPTQIGTGLGFLFLGLLGLLLFTGTLVSSLSLGALLVKHHSPLTFLRLSFGLFAGLALLFSLMFLPFLGPTLWFLLSAWGAGAVVRTIRDSQRVLKLEIPENLRDTPTDSTP